MRWKRWRRRPTGSRQIRPEAALAWLEDLWRKLDALAARPIGYGWAREHVDGEDEFRQIVHHSHRVIFTIDDTDRCLFVLRVRHAARRGVPRSQLR